MIDLNCVAMTTADHPLIPNTRVRVVGIRCNMLNQHEFSMMAHHYEIVPANNPNPCLRMIASEDQLRRLRKDDP